MLHSLKYNGIEVANKIKFARGLLDRTIGLMFKRDITSDYAMIFVLKEPEPVSIHMLFVFLPIDVIFLDHEKKITGLSYLKPWTGYKSMKDIKYVIEMKAGSIEKNEMSIGGQMDFKDI